MKTLEQKLETQMKRAVKIKSKIGRKKSIEKIRMGLVLDFARKNGLKVISWHEMPNANAGRVIRMANGLIRVYLTYGHGKYNYAMAMELEKL